MIVEKVFSNIEEPSESLYSVLMTAEELRTFAVPVANAFKPLPKAGNALKSSLRSKANMELREAFRPRKSAAEAINAHKDALAKAKAGRLQATEAKMTGKSLTGGLAKRVTPPVNNGFQMSSTLRPNGNGFTYV